MPNVKTCLAALMIALLGPVLISLVLVYLGPSATIACAVLVGTVAVNFESIAGVWYALVLQRPLSFLDW